MTKATRRPAPSATQGRQPQLWLLAGGNGAGKSTFYELFLKPRGLAFVNADRIARLLAPASPEVVSYDAARLAERIRRQLLQERVSFCFETVFSHASKIDFLADAKALGCQLIVVFIHLGDSQLNLARVAQRVREGGHAVPDEKVRARLPRTLDNIKRALPLADEVHLLDNARADVPFRRLATLIDGNVAQLEDPLPSWAMELLDGLG